MSIIFVPEKVLQKEREDLLGRRTTSTVRHTEETSSILGGSNGPDSTILMMDHMLRENDVLKTSGDRIDEFITMGRSALQELYEQRSMLKSTQRRLLDIANSLGLSTTVIRYIEQRTAADKWILWGATTTHGHPGDASVGVCALDSN
ncbi:protein transport protein bos1 [Quaeritorhiza haematococci]|nr:protein transport protein bos1 [Quaeritorhiza haematococci]